MNKGLKVKSDTKAGSLAYNRLDMQVSQTLHMAIELYPNLDYLLVLDYYDDISVFDSESDPTTVSYYQLKTSEDSISIDTAISENWLAKLYLHLNNPEWLISELGLITNCPLKVTTKCRASDGKEHKSTVVCSAAKTQFHSFNLNTIAAITKDIAKKLDIDEADVDLNKFVHIRTTLSIPKHNEIVEQELNDFLRSEHPKITLALAKTIYSSMMELLRKRQAYELLGSDSSFKDVRTVKGFSRNDFVRVIDTALVLNIPPFSEIQDYMNYRQNDIYKASYEYSRILEDVQHQPASFLALFRTIYQTIQNEQIGDQETLSDYAERIYKSAAIKRTIYNTTYIYVLIACIQINEWGK